MPAAIRRFQSRSELLRREQAARVREALAELATGYDGTPVERRALGDAVAEVGRLLDRQTAARNERSFIMLYPSQNLLVVQHLRRHSKWPKVAAELWAHLFLFARPEDGEILVTREGLIERVGASPRAVAGVLSELVQFGALIRRRDPEPGKQGRGTVRYFMNPSVGTQLPKAEREAAFAAAPPLRVVDGGLPPSERRSRARSFVPELL